MEEPEKIVEELTEFFLSRTPVPPYPRTPENLSSKKVLITAGPTYEKIDPVRFIGNYSSGKMGFALAEECARRGMEVILITGPVSIELASPASGQGWAPIHRINVESCQEMYDAATREFDKVDAAILCAAVADYRPEEVATTKIKRNDDESLLLKLVPNKDIAAELGRRKRPEQRLVGFALETNDEEANAQKKLAKKNLDFIVLNSTRNEGTTFRSDKNQISIISREGQKDFPKKPKTEVARDIIDELERIL